MRQIGNLPHISVITPVYNGMKTLERAVRSVLAQTFRNWELLLVDDCSTDDSRKIARALAAEDRRIRLIEKEENTGIGATRNVGLRAARGRLITYLDRDDEYQPKYLELLARVEAQGDIYLFGYDVVFDDDPQRPVEPWKPERVKQSAIGWNIVVPLGIAHRREWIEKVGDFNELVWIDEDSDLMKRFARGREVCLRLREERAVPRAFVEPGARPDDEPVAAGGYRDKLAHPKANLRRPAAGDSGDGDPHGGLCLAAGWCC